MSFREQLRAAKAVGARNFDVAVVAYKKMLENNAEDQFALGMLAFCYEWKGDIAQGIIYADKVLSRSPTDLDMLLLSARYWSESGDEERTYKFVCRALENASEETPEIPKGFFWLIKPFTVFKKFRGLEEKARIGTQVNKKYKEDHLRWAREYKTWYEMKRDCE